MSKSNHHTYGKMFFDFTFTNLSDRQIGIFLKELQKVFKYNLDGVHDGFSEIPISLELCFAKYTTPKTVSIPFTAHHNNLDFKSYLFTLLSGESKSLCVDLLRHAQGLNIRVEYTYIDSRYSRIYYTIQNINVAPDKTHLSCDVVQPFSVISSVAEGRLDYVDIFAILQKYKQNAYKYLLKYKD